MTSSPWIWCGGQRSVVTRLRVLDPLPNCEARSSLDYPCGWFKYNSNEVAETNVYEVLRTVPLTSRYFGIRISRSVHDIVSCLVLRVYTWIRAVVPNQKNKRFRFANPISTTNVRTLTSPSRASLAVYSLTPQRLGIKAGHAAWASLGLPGPGSQTD